MNCKNCGSRLSGEEMFCEACGTKVEREDGCFCTVCGAKNNQESIFCENCGADLLEYEENLYSNTKKENKNKIIIIVCILAVCFAIIGGFVIGWVLSDSDTADQDRFETKNEEIEKDREKEDRETKETEKDAVKRENIEKEEDDELKREKEESIAASQEETQKEVYEEYTVQDDRSSVLNSMNVESEVLRIREIYNNIQGSLSNYSKIELQTATCYVSPDALYKKYVVSQNINGINYEQWYFCENDQLIFAFYYRGQTEERFYFYRGYMFRWIDSYKTTRDKDITNPSWTEWEDIVMDAWITLY